MYFINLAMYVHCPPGSHQVTQLLITSLAFVYTSGDPIIMNGHSIKLCSYPTSKLMNFMLLRKSYTKESDEKNR